ncbi:hypothetical protein GIB67_038890 [Kingdonia uniflora]|uniref:Uncharacterized protein n=1 Tax=Kingdonia uniflora TaxID=39325 RepID=A0A7J7M2M8_9MAGN|nr:hypothetical protein GIB67_038890 [Kingdonia uniflora]
MKRRNGKGAPPTDLLVCFPARARHLTLMPKPICSPSRPGDPNKRHHNNQLTRSTTRGAQASPLLWAKTKPMITEITEPTSPKVTCAGQIKIRPKPNSCKNWQSVMAEIERIHKNKKLKKKPSWIESLGFKKDIMQFLTCLRHLRFDLRCFGSSHHSVATSEDEEDNDDEEELENHNSSRAIFSKWLMVLEEENIKNQKEEKGDLDRETKEDEVEVNVPPANALFLMRCRSAPAKSWLEEKQEEEEEEEEEEEKKKSLLLKCYDPDFFKVSSDVAKETWVVGGMGDSLSRSRSWKR